MKRKRKEGRPGRRGKADGRLLFFVKQFKALLVQTPAVYQPTKQKNENKKNNIVFHNSSANKVKKKKRSSVNRTHKYMPAQGTDGAQRVSEIQKKPFRGFNTVKDRMVERDAENKQKNKI